MCLPAHEKEAPQGQAILGCSLNEEEDDIAVHSPTSTLGGTLLTSSAQGTAIFPPASPVYLASPVHLNFPPAPKAQEMMAT